MPFMRIDTNVDVPAGKADEILKKLSAAASAASGKPEDFFQLVLEGNKHMLMGGTNAPAAHVEYKGINFQEESAVPLSGAVCGVLGETLGIDGTRIYITFTGFKGSMWGKNGGTF